MRNKEMAAIISAHLQKNGIEVSFILKPLGSGMTYEEILTAYPELEKDDILQAIQYASWL
ncbi:MAG: DUF433 domain-containing protein [Actinobacteria bacterium]|nr:DUF433 domain-containing protein [Cyanobacteriota bacterium]MCL6088295.1 DUF433 domain-containing protein [Actinomycetota bacterium]